MNIRALFFLFISAAVAAALGGWSLFTGLPSRGQAALLASSPEVLQDLQPAMKTLRAKIYSSYVNENSLAITRIYREAGDRIEVELNAKRTLVPEWKINAIRGALMQSRFPDEQLVVAALSRLKPGQLDFNPHLFQYGGLYIYTCAAALKTADIAGILRLSSDAGYYFSRPEQSAGIYAVLKLVGIIFFVLSLPLIYLAARELFDENAAIIAAVMLAVTPAMMVEAHNVKPFTFFMPFMLGALYCSARLAESGRTRWYLLGGLLAGFSAGTLITSGVILFSVITAHIIFCINRKCVMAKYLSLKFILIFTGFAVGFFVSNPYWLASLTEVRAEFNHLTAQAPFNPSVKKIFYFLLFELHKALGIPLAILGLAGLCAALFKPSSKIWLLSAAFVPFLIFTSGTHTYAVHYAMPLVPLAVLFACWFTARLGEKTGRGFLFRTLVSVVVFFTLMNSVYYCTILSGQGFMLDAGRWINNNVPDESSLNTPTAVHFSYMGYPPFNTLRLRVNEIDESEHFLTAYADGVTGSRVNLPDDYERIAVFERKHTPLDALFKNYLLKYFDQRVEIFKKLPA